MQLTGNEEEEAGGQLKPVAPRIHVELGTRHPLAVVTVNAVDQ
jgi:hypothetical protein